MVDSCKVGSLDQPFRCDFAETQNLRHTGLRINIVLLQVPAAGCCLHQIKWRQAQMKKVGGPPEMG